jgi:hypothetical protein
MRKFFCIATGIKSSLTGFGITTISRVIDATNISRNDAITEIVGNSNANMLFFYLEEEYMEAGLYSTMITAQSPQDSRGGYELRTSQARMDAVEGTNRSDALIMTLDHAGIPHDWNIMFFEIRPDKM